MSVQALSCAMVVRGVSASEKLLLLVLANYADEHMTCWPSHRRMASDACLTERTILTLLKGLEAKRLISRRERKREDGSRTTDAITLHFSGEVISPRTETDGEQVGKLTAPGGAEISPLTTFEPSLNHQPEPSADPTDEPAGFAEWWEAYPRKVARGAARKAYRAALKKAKPEVLLASLVAHRFSPEARYQPHPATWLNGECWGDSEPTEFRRPNPADDDPWPGRLTRWQIAQYWNSEWGPKPGKPGYRGPDIEGLAA